MNAVNLLYKKIGKNQWFIQKNNQNTPIGSKKHKNR